MRFGNLDDYWAGPCFFFWFLHFLQFFAGFLQFLQFSTVFKLFFITFLLKVLIYWRKSMVFTAPELLMISTRWDRRLPATLVFGWPGYLVRASMRREACCQAATFLLVFVMLQGWGCQAYRGPPGSSRDSFWGGFGITLEWIFVEFWWDPWTPQPLNSSTPQAQIARWWSLGARPVIAAGVVNPPRREVYLRAYAGVLDGGLEAPVLQWSSLYPVRQLLPFKGKVTF